MAVNPASSFIGGLLQGASQSYLQRKQQAHQEDLYNQQQQLGMMQKSLDMASEKGDDDAAQFYRKQIADFLANGGSDKKSKANRTSILHSLVGAENTNTLPGSQMIQPENAPTPQKMAIPIQQTAQAPQSSISFNAQGQPQLTVTPAEGTIDQQQPSQVATPYESQYGGAMSSGQQMDVRRPLHKTQQQLDQQAIDKQVRTAEAMLPVQEKIAERQEKSRIAINDAAEKGRLNTKLKSQQQAQQAKETFDIDRGQKAYESLGYDPENARAYAAQDQIDAIQAKTQYYVARSDRMYSATDIAQKRYQAQLDQFNERMKRQDERIAIAKGNQSIAKRRADQADQRIDWDKRKFEYTKQAQDSITQMNNYAAETREHLKILSNPNSTKDARQRANYRLQQLDVQYENETKKLDQLQNSVDKELGTGTKVAVPNAPASAAPASSGIPKVGMLVEINGQRKKITKVFPNGEFEVEQ